MKTRSLARHLTVATLCLLFCTALVLADKLKLRDGTVLEGKVLVQGDKYWIKGADGSSRFINKTDVLEYIQGDGKSPAAGAAAGTAAAPVAAPASGEFAAVKSKADRVDAPVQGVLLWETFLAKKPTGPDLVNAKQELEKWTALKNDNAEKIKGKWVGGVERKRIVKQAKSMVAEGRKSLEAGQSSNALKKFEEAFDLYPQSFDANFWLGRYYIEKSLYNEHARFNLEYLDKATKILENAAKIAPKSSSTLSNLCIAYSWKGRHQEAIKTAYKAAMMHESDETVNNLMVCIGRAPRGTRDSAWGKPIAEAAVSMAGAHQIEGKGFLYLPPGEGDEIPGSDSPAGWVWSGSGFFVTTDGYLITNHHVATGDPKTPIDPTVGFRVRMDDGTEKTAELIAVDDAADIAVMKITPDKPTVPIKIADYFPDQGAQILVLGYPATGEDEHTLEISDGSVKSIHEGDEHEVWMNLNTTHGNSGGPIVDSEGNMIAILTAGRESYNMTITLGVSGGQIKVFLNKIAAKAPKVQWAPKPKDFTKFSGVDLTKNIKQSTVCVIAVRNAG